MEDKNFIKFNKIVLGISMATMVGLMGYTIYDSVDSTNKWGEVEQTIETIALDKLNKNEQAKFKLGGEFSSYSFLCSDIEKQENATYHVNVNGFGSSNESNRQAFVSMKYVVDENYFSDKNQKNYSILNKVANIIKNENVANYSVDKVNDVEKLNLAFLNTGAREISKNYTYQNLLYGIDNLIVSDGVASFNAKSLVSYTNNFPTKYSPKIYYNFTNEDIKMNLTEKDIENAKADESYVFDKFCDYVSQNQKENYSVKELPSKNYKNYLAKDFEYNEELEK